MPPERIELGRPLFDDYLCRLPIDQYLELNRRFAEGYIRFGDHPTIKNSIKDLHAYMKDLKDNGLRDYQARSPRSLEVFHSNN